MLQVGSKAPRKIAKKVDKKAGNVKAPWLQPRKLRRRRNLQPRSLRLRRPSSTGEKAEKNQSVRERGHAREKRLASQGRPKEGTRLKVMWGGKFYSCSVVKTRYSAVKVHYIGWGEQFDEWVPFPSSKVKMDQ